MMLLRVPKRKKESAKRRFRGEMEEVEGAVVRVEAVKVDRRCLRSTERCE